MGLLSFFKRSSNKPAAKPVSDTADAVQQLRLQARRRLIGAAVLVALGVIGFPMVFETQPRPIPIDLPITIPDKDGVQVLHAPAVPAPQLPVAESPSPTRPPLTQETAPQQIAQSESKGTPAAEPAPGPVLPAAETIVAAKVAEAARPVSKLPEKPVEKSTEKHGDKVADKAVEKTAEKAADKKAAEKASEKAAAAAKANKDEAARVQALLDGKPALKADDKKAASAEAVSSAAVRLVLQVGAYADIKSAQEARHKVEKLGLKTYTQEVNTPAGTRIRVRVGPFSSRDEADKAAAKVRGTGLSTAVLTL